MKQAFLIFVESPWCGVLLTVFLVFQLIGWLATGLNIYSFGAGVGVMVLLNHVIDRVSA